MLAESLQVEAVVLDRVTAARNVPEALLLLRARSGLTQGELAARARLNERTIGNYETGKTRYRREAELARIVTALGEVLNEDVDVLWGELMGLSGVDVRDLEAEADVIQGGIPGTNDRRGER